MSLLSLARDLKRRKGRERRSLFITEGVRAVEELVRSPLVVRGVLITPELLDGARGSALEALIAGRGITIERVDERELASAADTESPQGVVAVAETPDHQLSSIPLGGLARLVILDGIQDPGNAGTILRTAAALGARGVVALPGTVDLWNAKVVRGAMGVHFRFPLVQATHDELFGLLASASIALWGAAAEGEAISGLKSPERLAIALGNEGAGLSPAVRDRCDVLVSIPIDPAVESLNVAVAAGIILHELRG
ncbi:MAG TPA: RNA methyltransferase [Gemmatimonadaceae bacterium]|nr:RNA methyltransferase [Gemmatimonadaceae bacterium]